MRYKHRFKVRAPLPAVADFHALSGSMAAITPPLIPLQMRSAPQRLVEGDTMAFRMWLGPVPVSWRAVIERVTADGFSDRQVDGPFAQWVHRHSFVPVDELTTEVVDTIQARIKRHPLWGPVGIAMWVGLPVLFAYRGWKTRRLLEDGADQ